MPGQDPIADWEALASVDSEEGALLVDRLRVVAESLNAEFRELSRAHAESLVFRAAQEVLSAASVLQFVPTFAERRARHLLHNGRAPATEHAAKESSPAPTDPAVPPRPTQFAAVPPWPHAFYTNEAKRLLERARNLRAGTLTAGRER